jgi:hypothetical protein
MNVLMPFLSLSVQEGMGDVTGSLQVAKSIADNGFMAVLTGFTLVAMFIMFRYFINTQKKLLERVMAGQEGAYLYESPMEQIRVIQSSFFDLAKNEMLTNLIRIFDEDNLHDKEQVRHKIEDVLQNIHSDRDSKLDNFKYHGIQLSKFTDPKWVKKMTDVCLKQIYLNEKQFNKQAAFSALDIAYNRIKIEFYNNILSKS